VFDEISQLVTDYFDWSEAKQNSDREYAQQFLLNHHGVSIGQTSVTTNSPAVSPTKIIENEQLVNGEEYVFNQ
jgi:hypothetical protein